MTLGIEIDRVALKAYCQRNHIRRLAFFGSVLGASFRPDSDVDVLVEFEPGHVPGFLALGRMQAELSEMLQGRAIDLVTPKFLNHRIRQRVLDTAEVVYVG